MVVIELILWRFLGVNWICALLAGDIRIYYYDDQIKTKTSYLKQEMNIVI